MKDEVMALLEKRGVRISEIAQLVLDFQRTQIPGLSLEECEESVEAVMSKRETQFAMLTGIALDELAEQDHLPPRLMEAVKTDDPLYGIDEVLALAVTNLYGSTGLIGFGYLDKVKPGVIGRLNRRKGGEVHTFLDDLIAAIAAAAGARLAYKYLGDSPGAVDDR